MATQLEQRLYDALKRITQYAPPEKLRTQAEKRYGLGEDEVIEMAYESVLTEAASAIKGMRRPVVKPAASTTPGAPDGN